MTARAGDTGRVRVAIVDDSPDIRMLLRVLFEDDERFDVVGEACDGIEGIDLAAQFQPNLLLLDRRMPRLGGVEALPHIRERAPHTTVIMFTTYTDAGTYHAALSAGAVDVLEKKVDIALVDRLAEILVGHWANYDAAMQIQVGPVPSTAARAWIQNTRRILSALRLHPDVLDEPIPDDVIDLFERFLHLFEEGNVGDEFYWTARAPASEVQHLVEWWARIDAMSDAQLEELGVTWAPPEGEPFFHALTAGVLRALDEHAATRELASRLRPQWTPEH